MFHTRSLALTALIGLLLAASPAPAWDAAGHRTITLLALDRLAQTKDCPEWLKSDAERQKIAWQSGEPDRWRGTRTPTLKHENDTDHYIDIEDLEPFGLTLRTMPMLRREYVSAMAVARAANPDRIPPVNPAADAAKTLGYPGFLPQAIMEHHDKLRSSFNTLRILESLPDASSSRRQLQIEQARANIRVEMGLLSHFVGDAAQPLHTTTHHHGWVGDNPKGYTTDRGIHRRIDGTVIELHRLNYAALSAIPADPAPRVADHANPWNDVLSHIERSFAKVEPLYALEKSGDLDKQPGKDFIAERLLDGAAMLGDLYTSAWKASKPTAQEIEDYLKYEAKD
jgi:hypothetical protein